MKEEQLVWAALPWEKTEQRERLSSQVKSSPPTPFHHSWFRGLSLC